MCGEKISHLLQLSSESADYYRMGNKARFSTNLLEVINIPDDKRAFISVRHARIPNLVQQVDETNNRFTVRNTDTTILTEFDIPPGNYTANQLSATIEVLLIGTYGANIECNHEPTSNKFVVSNQTALNLQLEFVAGYNTHLLLGFDQDDYVLPALGFQISPNTAILNPKPELYLHSNILAQYTYDNKVNGQTTTLETFPLAGIPLGIELFYTNANTEFRMEIQAKQISEVELWLTDRRYNEINFNNEIYHWEASILIQIE